MLSAGEPRSCGNFLVHVGNRQNYRVWCRIVDFVQRVQRRRDGGGEKREEEKRNNECESHCAHNWKIGSWSEEKSVSKETFCFGCAASGHCGAVFATQKGSNRKPCVCNVSNIKTKFVWCKSQEREEGGNRVNRANKGDEIYGVVCWTNGQNRLRMFSWCCASESLSPLY